MIGRLDQPSFLTLAEYEDHFSINQLSDENGDIFNQDNQIQQDPQQRSYVLRSKPALVKQPNKPNVIKKLSQKIPNLKQPISRPTQHPGLKTLADGKEVSSSSFNFNS